ncbi:MAG: hypothetical protein H6603_04120 [Flavobacteriales bacterium]|nr:hypothetical protein [Flavobacteriales bacterium]
MRTLLITSLLHMFIGLASAQEPCEDFLNLMGRREISQQVADFRKACGPFDETISPDGQTKTLTSLEKGITITFVNYDQDKSNTPKYEVFTIELTSFTGKGGYKGKLPLGFEMGMDPFMVKKHIKDSKDLSYDRSEVGIRRSYTNYSGPINDATEGRQLRVYVSQYDKKTIDIMRLRLK